MSTITNRKEILHRSMQAIREKIELLQSYTRKGNLEMCITTLTELAAYNELLNKIGIYSEEKKRLMGRIIRHYAPTPGKLLANRLKGGRFL
ncbi:MAG: hypothetical protein HFI50_17465 [Lachnospiraceae bacterium]|jgi:hypothetical protein|nr:hypothetical protein [Lachnospiraceae bacterium]